MTARILPCGDGALTVELSREIDTQTNARVIAFAQDIETSPIEGVREVVPTYRSLMVIYDPAVVRGRALAGQLLDRLKALGTVRQPRPRVFSVPVRYGGPVGQDLEALAEMKGMTGEDLIALHCAALYRVYMIGFAPGFAYLGGLPERLHTPRLSVPRQRVEAGAIGIGGRQGNINSLPGPSGWRFLGQTPVRLYDPLRAEPFLLKAGDTIRFRPIDAAQERELREAIAAGRTTGMEELST
ncbi:5-oxoprolinase subunit PxpB [Rhizobiaceae bacterium BDR2-2]|uniref:5-oxoprolinase subunit PxpB n=1 Tax=Ectorhizobium quercum TaxID=2965071 RepID=A0AAE3MZT8_9HYPH|nr:5-oxoprolinase subunit PxpB [Ectorhizobium quercum]MCX8998373.1 5-oxoprolinase subunit PxpB [Ectorhizobium quercum]